MNRLTTISATALLGCALALAGCSSDDSKDDATKAVTAATSAGASMTSSASEVSESVAADASTAAESASASDGSSQPGAAMPSVNAHTCEFDVSGKTAKGATTDLSCDDAKAIWAKVKEKTTTGQEKVEHDGETYECDMASVNGKTSASCHSGGKMFAFTDM